MIRRITLENFMSHRHTVIEPADGLTVLAGPNNCGKSAVVEALQVLCCNIGGEFMVRHGESRCRITVQTREIDTGEEHQIQWEKRGKVVSYSIDGRPIHRLRGGTPDDLHELLRLPEVEASDGKDKFDIHFAQQKDPLFLLGQTGSKAATFFASSSDAALLMRMQDRHKQQTRDAQHDAQRLAEKVRQIEQNLDRLAPVPEIDKHLTHAEQEHERLRKAAQEIAAMEGKIDQIKRQRAKMQRLTDRHATLRTLSAPPKLHQTPPLEELCRTLIESGQRVEREQMRLACVAPLPPPPTQAPAAELQTLCERMREQANRVEHRETATGTLVDLSAPPRLHDDSHLTELVTQLSQATRELERKEQRVRVLGFLTPFAGVTDTGELSDLIECLKEAQRETHQREREAQTAAEELDAASRHIRQWAQAHPTCPTCGAVMDADRLIATAGGADHEHA